MFGPSSERREVADASKPSSEATKAPPAPRVKKPSERYPNIPVREERIAMYPTPACPSCGEQMSDSGMTEDSEQLTVIPKKYEIILKKRVKYRCTCHGGIVTTPVEPRIVAGSSYSDDLIQDVVLSKYCDLIPIERYSAMAGRAGLVDLPTQSLIEVTHQFADFVSPVYTQIKKEILVANVLSADETPHRMLEGSEKKSWYLWGFSTPKACYLECRDTRSGDVASDILINSNCEVLLTDVYSGYGKAVRDANVVRRTKGLPFIRNAYCNAHARRAFHRALDNFPEASFYLDQYQKIYMHNAESKDKPPPDILECRQKMKPLFEEMRRRAMDELGKYSEKSSYAKGLRYFLENYAGLTLFFNTPEVAIDNNSQERLLRSPVVGRKTWYGTHSKRGALTAAILFSIVETCKLIMVNPREYIACLTRDLLSGASPYSPLEFLSRKQA